MSTLLSTAWTVIAPLADPVPAPEDVKPGWIALVVVLLLVGATVALWFNMRKQIGKVKFDDSRQDPSVDTSSDQERRSDGSPNGSGPA